MKTLDSKKIAGYPYTDGGKLDVLGDEGIIPTGTKIIEENGEHDVYSFEKVDVSVPQGVMVNESYDISEGTLNSATITLEGDVTAHIPDGVVTIGKTAFKKNNSITKAIMSDSVENIEDGSYYGYDGDGAFYQCLNLKNVELSNNLTSIGDYAFYSCTGLISIAIPDSVTSIGDSAFSNCSGLTSIAIPDSVTSIGDNAFSNCSGLTDIYYTGTQAEWEAITGIADAGIPETVTIHYEYTPEAE